MISTTALLGPVATHLGAAASQAQEVQKASGAFPLTWLLVALPLLSAGILLVGGRRTDSWGHVLGAVVPWIGFIFAAVMYVAMLNKPSDGRAFDQHLFNWIPAGSFSDVDLTRYNVLILPDGRYPGPLGESFVVRLKEWVRGGGTLILVKGAASWATEKSAG